MGRLKDLMRSPVVKMMVARLLIGLGTIAAGPTAGLRTRALELPDGEDHRDYRDPGDGILPGEVPTHVNPKASPIW